MATTRARDGGSADEQEPDNGRQPNDRLAVWFARSGWSKGELARQVNSHARAMRAPHVSTDTSRVRRWLDGEQPREPIPQILAELFTRRFGRVVGIDELGLREPDEPHGDFGVDLPWTFETVVEILGEYTRGDLLLGRQEFVGPALRLAAGRDLVDPLRRWSAPLPATPMPVPIPLPVQTSTAEGGVRFLRPIPLPASAPDRLRDAVRLFRRWDMQAGGGLRRKAVIGQLNGLTDLLRDPHPAGVRCRLLGLTAELALLAGWMSYDAGLQPGAQKYMVLALHAAKECDDAPFGANVLGVMARQMIHYEMAEDALDLVHLAQYGSRDSGGAALQAMLYALEGRAYATVGKVDRCRRALGLADQALSDSRPDTEPDWIRYFTRAELLSESGHAYRDLAYTRPAFVAPAKERLAEAVRLLAGTGEFVRSLALAHVGLATVHVIEREPSAAVEEAAAALDIALRVRSERLIVRLRRTVETLAARFADTPAVRELAARVARELPKAPFPRP
ncbi:hypothetical protein [Streptomyces sp. SID3343]|uniref:hypothetical protein n=1 Tax=Streptomyces sp. SID3343 TaxID=2690260 RepID=UPI00136A6AF1|nr:hypothetical protein [Streptomyces sp. SID3343]